MLEDLAILTNGRAITEDLGRTLENLPLEDLGRAKKVTIDPPASPVWPSYSRCFDVTPSKTTTYTLTTSDDAGHSASQAFTVKVQ